MAVYTDVAVEDLSKFISGYEIGELLSYKGIAEGVENSNFLLHTERGHFILTLYEKRVAARDLPFFLGLMEHLASRGLTCPQPVKNKKGEILGKVAGRPAAIVTFLEGMWMRRPDARHCAAVGEALAKLHLAGADFPMKRKNALSVEGWRPIFEACAERAEAMYGRVCQSIVPVTTPEVAEMAKLLENIFRSVNIALVNELAQLCDRMGIDIWEVVDAAATKPFGFMPFQPGPGLGGHCIPIDPFYLTWKAREYDFSTRFIELAGEMNQNMPYYCRSRISQALNHGARKSVAGASILVLGVAYKADIADWRESPAVKVIGLLQNAGASVAYHELREAVLV